MAQSPTSDAAELRRKAAACRELARGALPLPVADELRALAREYEAESRRLEQARSAPATAGR